MSASIINTPGTKPIDKVTSIAREIEAWALDELGIVMSHFYGSTTWPDHSNRRCLDAMIAGPKGQQPVWASTGTPLTASECHTFGDRLHAFVVSNAKRWGANGVIWDRLVTGFPHVANPPYRGPYGTPRRYTGSSPHTDHNHIEVDGTAYVPLVRPAPVVWDGKSFPGANAFKIGARGEYVTLLGERLIAHGWTGYLEGPGPEFTETDRAGVEWFQRRTPALASDPDGIPGPLTWQLLLAAPVVAPAPVVTTPKPTTPKPTPPVDEPDPELAPVWSLVANLDPPGSGAWQGAVQNTKSGDWYVLHSRGSHLGGSAEEVHVYRFTRDGRYRDSMVCVDAGHVYGAGVSDSGILWLTWDGPDGNDVVTISYRAGKTVRKSAASKMHMFTEASVQVSFDPTRDFLVVCEMRSDRYLFTKRAKADVLAGRDKPIGRVVSVPKSADWLQGFTLKGDALYVGTGKTDGRSLIKRYSFDDGKQTGIVDVTSSGLLPGESGQGAALELEGMDATPAGIVFTRKAFKNAQRRLRVYVLTNF